MLTLYCKGGTKKALGDIMYRMQLEVKNQEQTKSLGEKLGRSLSGGEVIELIGDVGGGKTTFVKGIATGLGIDEDVQSPSFTISRVYDARDDLILAHYDFYRLADPGIMRDELYEAINNPGTITVIEWADVVEGVLPPKRITIRFEAISEDERRLTIKGAEDLL